MNAKNQAAAGLVTRTMLRHDYDQAMMRAEAAELELRELKARVREFEPLLAAVDELLLMDQSVDEEYRKRCIERGLQHLRTTRGMLS